MEAEVTTMTRRTLLGAMLTEVAVRRGGATARRPNIVFVCSDQHSGRVLGANGHPIVRTPNLDRIAALGVNFRNAYTGNPVCAPGRAAMMTGRFASDVDSFCNSTPLGRHRSWGNDLAEAGYRLLAWGKMDMSPGGIYGFEEIKTSHGHFEDPDITSLFRAPVCFRPGERNVIEGRFADRRHHDAETARLAIEFLRGPDAQRQPWAIYVGLTMPHPRWVALPKYEDIYPPAAMPLPVIPAGYLEKRHTMFTVLANFKNIQVPIPEERIRRARAAYFGMVSELDERVGSIFDEIVKAGQLENTLFIYTSDHGEMLGEHGLWLKNVLLENAARVPLLVAGAGLPAGKVIETPVSHVDMVGTILEIAGLKPRPELRGHSLLGLVRGEAGSHPGFAFSESHSEGNCTGSFMIRRGDWKYLYFTGDEPLLFNLKEDPGEFNNLAGKPETAAIQKELDEQLTRLVDPDAVTERAFAAQERVLRGIIERMGPKEFYQAIVGRLGRAQARVLTMRYYRRRA